ncbi:MAG: hypothetical protein U9Q74_16085 [Gemmatimonadota bacterium]|nr:hypothetical protein [Gemmatimonadota bacterium]
MKFAYSTIVGLAARVTPGAGTRSWGFTIPVENPLMQRDATDPSGAGTRA